MHRCLALPEIASQICENLRTFLSGFPDRLALSVLARTSRAIFLEPALDALWRQQSTLVNLLRCMPKDLCEISSVSMDPHECLLLVHFRRPIRESDWDRATYNARRVRVLDCSGNDEILSQILPFLQDALGSRALFPRLRELVWLDHPESDLKYLPVFFGRDLVTLVLTCSAPNPNHVALLDTLADRSPSLDSLSIFGTPLSTEACAIIRRFRHITCLNLAAASAAGLIHFSHLPNLEDFNMRDIPEDMAASENEIEPLAQLTKFAAGMSSFSALRTALPLCADSPLQTYMVSIITPSPGTELERFFSEFAHNRGKHATSLVTLQFIVPYQAYEELPGSSAEFMFPASALRCLHTLSGLAHVHISALGFDIDGRDLLALGRALPNLISLALASLLPASTPPRLKLSALPSLVNQCQHLKFLDLSFDTAEVVPSRPSRLSHIELNVGLSPLEDGDQYGVMEFFEFCLPGVRLRDPWATRHDGPNPDLSEEVQRWRDVAAHLDRIYKNRE
ncbi:unnamed protein product [Mycena citricolor]|uniref:F-box domain-containing protein n=1 Tax=Mycena citricolor TaxID=2018698 RepID=A0AAD2JZN1_9AGAR|nr:unnamed protein product [Mycena citricolor]